MKRFIFFLASKTGAPLLAATTVACLIEGRSYLVHLVLLVTSFVLIGIDYVHNNRNSN